MDRHMLAFLAARPYHIVRVRYGELIWAGADLAAARAKLRELRKKYRNESFKKYGF